MSESKIVFADGASYEQMMGVWSRLVGSKFLKWLSPADGQKWIDVGCGTGAFTEQIIQDCRPQEVHGVDPSGAQIEFAKSRASRKEAHFRVGDAMNLPFETNEFDASTMALVIFFVPDPVKGVDEMKRVVRSGGLVAAYAWDMFSGGFPLEPIQAELRSMNIEHPLPPSAEASRMGNMQNLWINAGLRSVETRKITVERIFDNFDHFWDLAFFSPALKPVFEKLDAITLNNLKNATEKRLTADSNGQITYAAHANAIKGRS